MFAATSDGRGARLAGRDALVEQPPIESFPGIDRTARQ